jgi:hypothetical protein
MLQFYSITLQNGVLNGKPPLPAAQSISQDFLLIKEEHNGTPPQEIVRAGWGVYYQILCKIEGAWYPPRREMQARPTRVAPPSRTGTSHPPVGVPTLAWCASSPGRTSAVRSSGSTVPDHVCCSSPLSSPSHSPNSPSVMSFFPARFFPYQEKPLSVLATNGCSRPLYHTLMRKVNTYFFHLTVF